MMSYGIHTIKVHKKLKLDKRANSSNWYARLTLDNGKRIVRSTKTRRGGILQFSLPFVISLLAMFARKRPELDHNNT
jgi:hypothetical protein